MLNKNQPENALKIFLIEDHHLMRRGLAALLMTEMNVQIIGEAGTGEDGLKLLSELETPDLVIMDISLPGMNGIEATRKIKALNPEIKILVLSMYDNPISVYQAIEAGASGYILKKAMVEELNLAIDAIILGGTFLSPSIPKNMDVSLEFDNFSYQSFTHRELEVFKLLANGLSVNDIADTLFISIYTVYTHISNIKRKVGIEKTSDLTRYAMENPLILSQGK
jgi:NarL family two-component system response regulator LiaR